MPLGGSADLKGIRTGVADIAARVGLHDYDARAAVLAVHEAALLACAGGGSSNGPGPSEPVVDTGDRHVDGLLEVRVAPGSLFTEVRVPRSNAAPTSASANTSAAVDPTGHVGWFCHAVTAHDSHTDWTIRVLTDLRRSTAQGSMSLDH